MSWFSFKKNQPKKISNRKSHQRSFELLEKRQVLAGVVDYMFANRNLDLKGDGASQSIEIFRDAAGYWLRGNDGETFVDKTPPNIDPFPTFPGTPARFLGTQPLQKITIDLGDGSDTLFIHGSGLGTIFTTNDVVDIKMGAGNDLFTLDFYNANDRFNFDSEAGGDDVIVTHTSFQSNVTIDTGDGSDSVSLTGDLATLITPARPIIVNGIFNVDLGAGSDDFTASVFLFDASFSLDAGDGVDSVYIGGLTEPTPDADTVDNSFASQINGAFNVDLGSGIDNLTVTLMTVFGSTSIDSGEDNDSVFIRGSTDVEGNDGANDTSVAVRFDGPVSIDLGAGNNNLQIVYANFGSSLTIAGGANSDTVSIVGYLATDLNVPFAVAGNTSIDLGDGTNNLSITYAAFGAGLAIKGGNGTDTVFITGQVSLATPLTTAASINVDLGDGVNKTTMIYVDAGIAISIKGGAGADTVILSGDVSLSTPLTTFSTLSIDLGNGGNTTTLTFVDVGTSLNYKGGADGDSVTIRGDVPSQLRSSFGSDSVIDMGDGANVVNITYSDFDRSLSIIGGSGSDNVIIAGEISDASPLSIVRNLNVNLGNGGNSMTLTYVDIGAALVYTGGDDSDVIIIRGNVPAQLRSAFGADSSINLGDGSNSVNITYTDFARALSITGGDGTDNVTFTGETTDDRPVTVGGNLTVNLDDGSNSFTATYFAGGGNFTYVGGDGIDTVRLIGVLAPPPSQPYPFTLDGNVLITLGASNDTVSMDFVQIDGNVTINAGDGNDNVTIHGLDDTPAGSIPDLNAIDSGRPMSIDGNVTIDLGVGNDRLLIEFGSIGGNATLLGDAGNDTITVSGKDDTEKDDLNDTSAPFTIGGTLTVDLGDGTNAFNMDDATVDGGMNVFGGTGVDTVTITGKLGSGNPFRAGRQLVIGGAVNVLLDSGNDTFVMSAFLADNNFTIDTGAGNDTLVLRGLGDTLLDVDAVDSGIQSEISGTLIVLLQAGNDSALLDFLAIGGNLGIDAGAGNDTVTMVGNEDIEKDDVDINITPLSVGLGVVIALGEGNNSLFAEYFVVGRAFLVSSGSGADSIVLHGFPDQYPNNGIDDSIPSTLSGSGAGNLEISAGGGADFIDVLNVQIQSGGFITDTGAGADTISIGVITATQAISISTGTEADNVQIDSMSTSSGGITIDLDAGNDRLIANTLSANGSIIINAGANNDEIELGGGSSATGAVTIDLGTAIANSGVDSIKMDTVSARGEITVTKGLGGRSDMYLDFLSTNAGVTLIGNDETDEIRLFNSSARTHFNVTTFAAGGNPNQDGNDVVYISASDVTNGGITVSTGVDDDHVEIGLYVNIMQLLSDEFEFFFDGDLDGDGVFDGGRVQVRTDIVVDTGFVNTKTNGSFSGSDYVFVGWVQSLVGNLIVNTGDLSDTIDIYNLFVERAILNSSDSIVANDINDAALGGANDTVKIGYLTTYQTFDVVTGSGNDLVSFYASRLYGVGNVNAGEDHDTVATVVQLYDSDFFIQMLTGYNTLICDNVISSANFYYAATAGTGNATVKNSQAVRMNLTLGNDYDQAAITNNTFYSALFVSMGSGDDWLTVTGNYLPYEMTLVGGEGRGDRLTLVGSSGRPTAPVGFELFF